MEGSVELVPARFWAAEQTGGRLEKRHDMQPAVAPPPPLSIAQIEHFKKEGYVRAYHPARSIPAD